MPNCKPISIGRPGALRYRTPSHHPTIPLKTMENLRKRVNVKLVHSHEEDKLRRLIASPAFARANIFDDDLDAIQIHKSRLALNRPVFVGMSILDLSKHLMYDIYYNLLRGQYVDRCQLLYTDTDSLLLEVQTEDVFRDMASHAELYDTSDYLKEHPLHSIANKKVLGKMKEECAGRPIAEYVSLRPKMYSILEAGEGNIKKAKGVKKNVVKKHIRHEQYKEALIRKRTFHHSMESCGQSAIASTGSALIRSRCHPSNPSAGSQKMGWTRWPMGTKTPFRLVLLRWMHTSMNCSALKNAIRRKLSRVALRGVPP